MKEKEKDLKKKCKCKQYVVGFGQKGLLVKHKPFLMKQKTFKLKKHSMCNIIPSLAYNVPKYQKQKTI